MKALFFIFLTLLVMTISLEIVNVYTINKMSTDSIKATKVKEEIKKIEEKNITLRNEILVFTSLSMIASEAANLGFVESKNYISLYSPLEVALKK